MGTKFDWDPVSARREVGKLDVDKIIEKVPAFARLLEHRHLPNDWRELIARTGEMMLQLGEHPLLTEDILATVKNDVEIWLGDRDDMADREYSQRVAKILPNAQFKLLPDTPHAVEKLRYIPFRDDPSRSA
jgi:pimeloyl-ACP methyl ester carboxylesterase